MKEGTGTKRNEHLSKGVEELGTDEQGEEGEGEREGCIGRLGRGEDGRNRLISQG